VTRTPDAAHMANVAKPVPCAFRQREQWQWCIISSGAVTSQATVSQRQVAWSGVMLSR
jgi:hypothetical protein